MINENELKEGLIEHLKGMIELSGFTLIAMNASFGKTNIVF